MEFLPSFAAWPFAVAGLIAAVGPFVIHLLNRRRFHVVDWAAMDFLREALERNRRILQMRDLILLLLRTVAVLLVGFALAQPFFTRSDEAYDGSKPLHTVLVIDNSMSMGYESLEGTLLDRAKNRARQLIDKLPADSRVSVIPLCGSEHGYSPDAYTKKDALQALDTIEVVDRSASVQRAINEAQKACEAGPMLGERVVILSDQQVSNWRDLTSPDQFDGLPSLQVVDVSPDDWENTWVSDLRIQDGVADIETPTTFIVEVRHEGASSRHDVQVTLSVDDIEVASKTVTLEPALGAREVPFEYLFNSYQPEPGKPVSVPIRASITPDRLAVDDERHLVVHVVAALPVVFVDQYGEEGEAPVKARLGETRHLRKLLAPVTSRNESPRQLVKTRHIRLDQLEQNVLEDARLVVVAGIADPGSKVPLLREYVEQGGRLVIVAGGDYDPAINGGFDADRWTDTAWLEGAGILPAPLLSDPIGATPDEANNGLEPFFLSYDSLSSHYYFQLAGVGESELRDLYAEPFFFKAFQADLSSEAIGALHEAEMKRLEEKQDAVADAAKRRQQYAKLAAGGELTDEEQTQLRDAEARLQQMRPNWLLWNDHSAPEDELDLPEEPDERARVLSELAARTHPRVLARFDNSERTPYLVERRIGQGNVLFVSSGLLSDWNTLPQTNTMLIFDRILRSLVQSTLPQRNFPGAERITLPLPAAQHDVTVALRRPGREKDPEILDTGFIGSEQLGFYIQDPLSRGLYRVAAYRPASETNNGLEQTVWEVPLTVNGDSAESELQALSREQFQERTVNTTVGWVGAGEDISLAGAQIRGQHCWWWLIVAVLGLLLVELTILLGSTLKARGAGENNGNAQA